MKYYKNVKASTNQSQYLTSSKCSFKGIQLKFRLRTGTAGIGEDLVRQNRGPGDCKFCGAHESLKHIVLYCKEYNEARYKLFTDLKSIADKDTFNVFLQDPYCVLFYLLTSHDDPYNVYFTRFIQTCFNIRNIMSPN